VVLAVLAGLAVAPALRADENPRPADTTARRIAIGDAGWLEFHLLLQGWFLGSLDDNEPYAHLGKTRSSFRLRRTEIKFSGQVIPEVSFALMLDPAKVLEFGSRDIEVANQDPAPTDASRPEKVSVLQPTSKVSALQDFVITFRAVPYASLSVGQAKTPISYEGFGSSAELLFVERSEVGRIFGDQRDLGVFVHYRFDRFAYHIGLYNGAGANNLDTDAKKDLAIRLEVLPVEGLLVALSAQQTLSASQAGMRTIAGGDIRFERGPFLSQAEFYWSRSVSRDAPAKQKRPMGGYIALAYTLGRLGGDWQVCGRFDWFDPDGKTARDDFWRATGGVNFLLQGHRAKVQVNYTRTQPTVSSGTAASNHLVLVNTQVSF